MPFIAVTTVAEIGAGAVLLRMQDLFLLIPGLLFLLPGLMTLRGNIASSMAQRLGSAIHIGIVSWEKGYNQIIRENVNASVSLSLIVSAILSLGIFAWSFAVNAPISSLVTLVIVALSTAGLSGVIQSFIAVFVAVYAAYRGLDPDNVTIPILAMIGDLLTVGFILAVAGFLASLPMI